MQVWFINQSAISGPKELTNVAAKLSRAQRGRSWCNVRSTTCGLALGKGLPGARPRLSHAASPGSASVSTSAPGSPDVLPPHDTEAWPSNCDIQLGELARFTSRSSLNGPGECGASDVVRLENILMPSGEPVILNPAATLRCPMAVAVAHCIRDDSGLLLADLAPRW
jgi:hypothetical protein